MASKLDANERIYFGLGCRERQDTKLRIAADIKAMRETTMETRELIAECRKTMRKIDQLLRRE